MSNMYTFDYLKSYLEFQFYTRKDNPVQVEVLISSVGEDYGDFRF